MPPVLISRVARNLLRRRRHGWQFVRALPSMLLVTTTWMLGESRGYLAGGRPHVVSIPRQARAG
jgi:hypothetical protein